MIHTQPTALSRNTPWLAKLYARGKAVTPTPTLAWSEAVCSAFGIARQQDWPIAACCAQAAGLNAQNGYWLRLDPVHLDLGMHGLFVRPCTGLDMESSGRLAEILRPQFADAGMTLCVGQDASLFAHSLDVPDLVTTPLDRAIDRQAAAFLPRGRDAVHWARLLNSVQMTLHEHDFNSQRIVTGDRPINSIWPWGGGSLPATGGAAPERLYSDQPLPQQLAQACQVVHQTLPGSLSQLAQARHTLVTLGSDRDEADDGAALRRIDAQWCQPLLAALKFGAISTARVDWLEGDHWHCVRLERRDAWRFWRN